MLKQMQRENGKKLEERRKDKWTADDGELAEDTKKPEESGWSNCS